MTSREAEVMRAKNMVFLIILGLLFGTHINRCPPWGAETWSLIAMPLLTAFFHGVIMLLLYHAKGEFGNAPTNVGWGVFLAPLSMIPALYLSPADNEVAGCTLIAVDTLLAFTVLRTAMVDLSGPVASLRSPFPAAQDVEVAEQDELPAALSQIQRILQTHELGPQGRMQEIAALSAQYAEQVSDLTPVS